MNPKIKMFKKSFVYFLFLFSLNLFINSLHAAQWPTAVNGESLPSLAPILQKANPSVVNIATTEIVESPYSRDSLFGLFGQRKRFRQANSLGSGVIIDAAKGIVLTNHHVIANAHEITVSLEDGREFEATVMGKDQQTDVAVLKVEAPNLASIPLGDSDALKVGDFVVAIGNPYGLGHSVTSGIVSAKGRSGLGIEQYEDFIQTDAAINPGNSGGALINLKGELIGINTAILGPQGNIGIGFAIPINLAKTITQHLIEYGEVRRGLLGISVQQIDKGLAHALGLSSAQGVIVTEVGDGSAAQKAGIKTMDVIIGMNGKRLRSSADLLNQEGLLPAGSQVPVELVRDNKTIKMNVILELPKFIEKAGDTIHRLLSGVKLGIKQGVPNEQAGIEVLEVTNQSRAAYYGLRTGDIIEGLGRYRVTNFDELKQLSRQVERSLPLRIRRNNEQFLVMIR